MAHDGRFGEALALAAQWHDGQYRKGTTIPYASHLLSVCALVLDDGGDPDEAIAALLHDAIEDTEHTASEIESLFGHRVAAIVMACTDADPPPGVRKDPWKPRKDIYLARLASHSDPGTIRVSAADKLANVRAILADHRRGTPGLWDRFKGGLGGSVWYYRSLATILGDAEPASHLVGQLIGEVQQLSAVAATVSDRIGPSATAIGQLLASSELPSPPPGVTRGDEWLGLELARRLALAGPPWPDSSTTVVTAVVHDVFDRWYRDAVAADVLADTIRRLTE